MNERIFLSALMTLACFPWSGHAAVEQEIDALRALVNDQRNVIAEQARQINALAGRVAALEHGTTEPVAAETIVADAAQVPSTVDLEGPNPKGEPAQEEGEISQDQKKDLMTGKETQVAEEPIELSESVDLYGSFRLFAELGSGDSELSDGSSRLGVRFFRKLPTGVDLFGRVEWKINLVDNDSTLAASEGESGGITVSNVRTEDAFGTRLGYIGGRFAAGELTIGKQWSVYYDVTGWTDNFNVYGGSALSTYNAGTDGGAMGSGRADQAIVFRSKRGRVSYGLQTQLSETADDSDYEGFGGSLIFSPSESWDLGFAFVDNKIDGTFEQIAGTNDAATYALAARYHAGPWYAALGVAQWDKHEAVYLPEDTIIYDGWGSELFASYQYSPRLHFYGGFNYTDPDIDDPRVDPDFGTKQLLLGTALYATPQSFSYIELLLSNSTDLIGESQDSVVSIGYRYDF